MTDFDFWIKFSGEKRPENTKACSVKHQIHVHQGWLNYETTNKKY